MLDRYDRTDRLVRHSRREVPSDRREDVAAVEARGDDREHEVAVLDRPSLGDPAEGVRGRHQQAVVGADEDVAAIDLERDRQPLGADAGVDDRHVRADGHVRQCEHERARPIADRVPRHLMVDVDDVRIGADREHHASADRRSRGAEIGQERDDRSIHAPDGTEAPALDVPKRRREEARRPIGASGSASPSSHLGRTSQRHGDREHREEEERREDRIAPRDRP